MDLDNIIRRATTGSVLSEQRTASAASEPSVITGTAVVFDRLSEDLGGFVERIIPGAIEIGADCLAFANHDPAAVLGRVSAGTLRLLSDLDGVHFEVDAPDTTYARDLLVSMRRGDVSQCSFAAIVDDDDWDYDRLLALPVRTIKRARLLEVSVVSMPAYPQTSAEAT